MQVLIGKISEDNANYAIIFLINLWLVKVVRCQSGSICQVGQGYRGKQDGPSFPGGPVGQSGQGGAGFKVG